MAVQWTALNGVYSVNLNSTKPVDAGVERE